MPQRFLRWTVPLVTAVATLLTLCVQRGEAQAEAPTAGDWSVTFTLFEPDEVTNLGVFRMVTDRANVGLEVDLNWSDGDQEIQQSGLTVRAEGTTWSLAVGPSLRWYGSRMGPVSPYLRTKVSVGWERSHLEVNGERRSEDETFTVLGSLAIGAEWYPVERLGIGGHTGVAWTTSDIESRNLANESSSDSATSNVRTFRSGLVVSFYFR